MSRFMVRKLADTGVAPIGNLVKARHTHLLASADDLLARLEEQGKRAYASAVKQGRRDGEAEGRKARAALLADTLTEANGYWSRAEKRLAGIVMDAVRRIIGEFDNAELTAGVVRQLVREVEDEGKIRVRVSADEFRFVRDSVRDMQRGQDGGEPIEVIADAAIARGGCRMETEIGFVETSVDGQLEALRAALEKELGE